MVFEVAEIQVTDSKGFEAAFVKARSHILAAEGCRGVTLHRVVETPSIYRLIVKWDTIEDHMVKFRNSEAFKVWRELASPFFSVTPKLTHSQEIQLDDEA